MKLHCKPVRIITIYWKCDSNFTAGSGIHNVSHTVLADGEAVLHAVLELLDPSMCPTNVLRCEQAFMSCWR